MDGSSGNSNSSLQSSLFLKTMQQPEISTAVPSCNGENIEDSNENAVPSCNGENIDDSNENAVPSCNGENIDDSNASSSVDPKTESFEEMLDRVIRELRAKDNNGSLQTLFLNIMSRSEIEDIDPNGQFDYGDVAEPASPFPFCPRRAHKRPQNSAAAHSCNCRESACDPNEKKVLFSQLDTQVLDVPKTESSEEIPDRAIRKLRAKETDKNMEGFEERIDRIIRELRMKDDQPQETFPPCVAHGLAVRMDTIS